MLVMAATPEEEAIIKKRFLTQVAASKGVPPAKELAKKWLQFCEAVKGGQPAKAAELRMAVLRDLAALRSAVQRQQVTIAANAREQEGYAVRRAALDADIAQAHEDIAARRQELVGARTQKQYNEQYEALRKAIMKYPKRASSSANAVAVRAETEAILAEGVAIGHTIDRRRGRVLEAVAAVDALAASFQSEDSAGIEPMTVQ